MSESSTPTNMPADNACNIGAKVFLPGLCPDCGADVKIDWKNCKTCQAVLG